MKTPTKCSPKWFHTYAAAKIIPHFPKQKAKTSLRTLFAILYRYKSKLLFSVEYQSLMLIKCCMEKIGLALANSLMFTRWRRAGAMSRLVNQAHWGSIMSMIMTASRMGVIEGRWVMDLGRMPRTEESRKCRSTFTKTQVPRWGLMLQLAAAPPKWLHISCSKPGTQDGEGFPFFFPP